MLKFRQEKELKNFFFFVFRFIYKFCEVDNKVKIRMFNLKLLLSVMKSYPIAN